MYTMWFMYRFELEKNMINWRKYYINENLNYYDMNARENIRCECTTMNDPMQILTQREHTYSENTLWWCYRTYNTNVNAHHNLCNPHSNISYLSRNHNMCTK